MSLSGEEQLVALVLIPLVCAALLPLFGRWPNIREGITLISSLLLVSVAWPLAFSVEAGARTSRQHTTAAAVRRWT